MSQSSSQSSVPDIASVNEDRTLVIAASSKHFEDVKKVEALLKSRGISCYTPEYAFDETRVSVDPTSKERLTRLFLAKIDRASALYLVTRDGYVGLGATLETGYAKAKGKPIFASAAVNEPAVMAVVDRVVSADQLTELLLMKQPH